MPRDVRRGETEYGGRGGFDKIARTEMAREKARILGKQPEEVSPFEQAAQELMKRGEEEKRRQAQPRYGGGGPRDDEMPLVSFHELPLKPRPSPGAEDEDTSEWKQYRLEGDGERRKPLKMNGAMINYLALNIRTREWAKAMGTQRSKKRRIMQNFEREAERWAARKLLRGASAEKR